MIDTERCSGREKEINRERDNNGKRVEMERHGEVDKEASESWEDKDREFMKEKWEDIKKGRKTQTSEEENKTWKRRKWQQKKRGQEREKKEHGERGAEGEDREHTSTDCDTNKVERVNRF